MKKIFLIFGIFGSTFFFAQKSKNFHQIAYNSICCGTPSLDPVIKYIENFQGKKKSIEVYRQLGLGREGEFKLYIGTDCLSKSKKTKFLAGLESTINMQNNSRNKNSDGIIVFRSTDTITKENLKKLDNLTIYKKEN